MMQRWPVAWPSGLRARTVILEAGEHRRREEPAQLRIAVRVLLPEPPVVVTKGQVGIEMVASPCHGHVQEAPLLFDRLGIAGGKVGRDVAVGDMEEVYDIPLAALRRVDRTDGDEVLVERWRTSEIARGRRRVQREVGQELAKRRGPRRRQRELFEVCPAGLDVGVAVLEAGVEPPPGSLQRRTCPLLAEGRRLGDRPGEAERTGPGVIRDRGQEATLRLAGLLERG